MPLAPRPDTRRVLLLRMGEASPGVREAIGDYPDWFRRHLDPLGVQLHPVAVFDGEVLPYGGHYDGIILTGSACGVRDELPWMRNTGAWALKMAAHTPVLAVCFGHQLLGEAMGGRVEAHAQGPEWGTVEVELTPEGRRDPLFQGLPDTLLVQQLHKDHVENEPEPHRFTRLAGNAHTPLQAYAVGPWLRAVQFHPELSATDLGHILRVRQWPATSPLAESAHGAAILANWVRHFVRRAG